MEDDFLFYHPMDYVKQSMDVLSSNNQNIHQIVFNRNYAETIEHYNSQGHLPTDRPNIVLHQHLPHDSAKPYMNSHYWPHYSFRPAMTLVKTILALGNFDSPNQFFERDYANKWQEAGYQTAFFNRISHRHIGRLTSEINKGGVKNAYELNAEAQFQAPPSNIKIINLERRTDRKLVMTQLLKTANIRHFTFFKAVEGKTLECTNELKKLFINNDFGNRKGVMGCALSHLQLWKELLADKYHDYYLILEDDITINSQFKTQLEKLNSTMKEHEVLMLGYSMFPKQREAVKEIYDIESDVLQINPLNKELYMGGTFAYSINKIGAQKLLDYIAINGIKHGIDYLMKITPQLNMNEIQPLIVRSAVYEDKTSLVDTDIQSNYESLDLSKTLEDHFEFVPKLDQIGYDIYFQKGTLSELMSKALKDPQCVGFNTLGFFKNKIKTLSISHFFKDQDGIYIKRAAPVPAAAPVRLKMLCNWCTSEQLCQEWANMYTNKKSWKNIIMTASDDPREIDYYVIINSPPTNAQYIPEKTIVFQMEPWVADPEKNWGVKTWGEWAKPDPNKFFKVFTHQTHLNNVQWQIDYPFYSQPIRQEKQDKIATICSQKNFDKGHLLRNNFLRYISETSLIDVYGRENYHQFKNYKGVVPADNKYNVYAYYKYVLAVENNSERNYATEKIWEAILCECLCFYWGCTNLEEYLDPQAFVRLPIEDPIAAQAIIQQAITEDWWSQRITVIKQMKEKILNELGFFPLMKSLVTKPNCVICLCVYNNEIGLPYCLKNITKLTQSFNELKVIVFYDDSRDKSLELLNSYKENSGIAVDILINTKPKSTIRTENIALARNSLVNQIKEKYSNYDYFIMMDTNEYSCIGDINLNTLDDAIANNSKWDAISFDRAAGYYDLWALSFDPYIYSFFHFKTDYKDIMERMRTAFQNVLESYRINKPDELIPVYSAFNGFCLYKTSKFLNCSYNSTIQRDLFPPDVLQKQIEIIKTEISDRKVDDCEHRAFHLDAIQKNNAKIRVSTQFLFSKCVDPPPNLRGPA